MLSETQIAAYRERGYIVADYRLPAALVEDLWADHPRLAEREPHSRNDCSTLPAHFDRDVARRQELEMGAVDHPHRTLFPMRGSGRCGRNDHRLRR